MARGDIPAPFSNTSDTALRALWQDWRQRFEERTRTSFAADIASGARIAHTQRQRFSSGLPYPIYVQSGKGAQFDDLDGNEYLDLTAGWNAAMLGRGNAAIVAAVTSQMETVGAPGGAMHPSLLRDEFAERLAERLPGAERLLFAPSGSEANTFAIRLARAFTGKEVILRIEGGWHGQYDYLLGGQSSLKGLPKSVGADVVEVPYNDLDRAAHVIEENRDRLCAVIVEGMMTIPGAIHQRGAYIQQLRDLALKREVPFILDEVITGSRFAIGGAAEFYKVTPPPDLMVHGKMLGGGLPLAVVAGRAEIVEQNISASNTHAQNPVCLAAALATFDQLDAPAFKRVCTLGEALRAELRNIAASTSLSLKVTGDGPCCGLHFSSEEIVDYASAQRGDQELWRLMCLGVANEGLSISSRTFGPTVPFDEGDIERCAAAFGRTLFAIDSARS